MSFRTLLASTLGLSLLVTASSALAQEEKEKPAQGHHHSHAPDHDKFVGRFAVGYMGVSELPIGPGARPGEFAGTVTAPIIGMRYWFNKQFGIDAGIGLGVRGGSRSDGNTTTDAPSALGFALHGGVPIALVAAKHYTFEVIPEINLGFANRTTKQDNQPDRTETGFRFDVGARVGAEVHFGFIGIPELALQATIGLRVSAQSGKSEQSGKASTSTSKTEIGTTVQDSPWAIFTNTISALYYF